MRGVRLDGCVIDEVAQIKPEVWDEVIQPALSDRKGWAPRGQARGGPLGGGPEGAGDPQVGTPYAISVNAGWRLPITGLLCKEPPYGGIRAIDLATGRTLWDRPFGTAKSFGRC